eukprot:911278-Prorocentrum_minimum.AAC.1
MRRDTHGALLLEHLEFAVVVNWRAGRNVLSSLAYCVHQRRFLWVLEARTRTPRGVSSPVRGVNSLPRPELGAYTYRTTPSRPRWTNQTQ